MFGKKGGAGWGNVKELIDRGIVASSQGEEDSLEFANIAQDIQRIAVLYGEELFTAIPTPVRKKAIDLFGISTEQNKKLTEKESVADEKRKADRMLQQLIGKFYRERTTEMLYEDEKRHASLSTTRVRQRLCDLMGTDVIRLNDKRYFEKLTERLQDEYETVMDKQEDARAASEEERLRRLMLEGIIDAPNDYRAVVHGHEKKQNKKKKRRKTKRPTSSKITFDTKSSDDEGQSKTRKEDVVTQVEMLSDSRGSHSKSPVSADGHSASGTKKSSMKKVSIDDKENERLGQTLNEMHARPPHHENALRPSSSCSTHRKSRRVKSAAPRLSHWEKEPASSDDEGSETMNDFDTRSLPEKYYVRKQSKYSTNEPERVSKLRTEETVAGLYSIAEELVSPVRADEQLRKKVIPPKQKKKKMTMSSLKR